MTAHPLAELADALFADPTPQQRARTARVLRSLHPDVARVALALAEGLTVPDGWRAAMDADGDLEIHNLGALWTWVRCNDADVWSVIGGHEHPTAQAAVDAAVEALGGPR